MAKGNRQIYLLQCTKCEAKNYSTSANRISIRDKKIELKKLCPKCNKHTLHKMVKTK